MLPDFFKKPFVWAAFYGTILASAALFVLLDAFVIPRAISAAPSRDPDDAGISAPSDPVVTDNSYSDGNLSVSIETVRRRDTDIYVADITLSDPSFLKTAFAGGTYGRNITAATSDIAEENDAIFAVNGDYYGFRDYGFVVRNGVLYRGTAGRAGSEALALGDDGNLTVVSEADSDAGALVDAGAWQVWSFGPALIEDGEIAVSADSEVQKAASSNPRTAIGQISPLHYIVIVSDGRTDKSAGLSLLELAQEFADRGCTVAYNLDGGGSSTMWFMGKVINNPTDGHSTGERRVSDIVYLGY